jgi:hypothetical protein
LEAWIACTAVRDWTADGGERWFTCWDVGVIDGESAVVLGVPNADGDKVHLRGYEAGVRLVAPAADAVKAGPKARRVFDADRIYFARALADGTIKYLKKEGARPTALGRGELGGHAESLSLRTL